ncbi:MAG TPA: histidine kinase dimerization/phospho-acceptor domain-containing protein [Polyangiaceae bacterium]|nr:histidine kinase dimerization/phospho-acceptor domain-containing protein [Polyangiaceae bacterium]
MIRLIVVAAASVGLMLFVAFVVSRLLRTRTRGMSIRMQIFLALAVIVGAFAFGLGLMVIDRIEARAVRLSSQAAEDEAVALAGMMAGELDRTGVSIVDLAARLEHERGRGADLRLMLLDDSGARLFPAQAPAEEHGVVSVDAPIRVRSVRVGAVRVVKPTIAMRNLLADFAPTVLVISLVLGTAAALAAAWIGRAIAAPIEALSVFGERVSLGERRGAPPQAFGREVTRLTRAIDSMRRDLEGRPFVETFASDLSHELKNPVAAIRASAEVLEESALEEPVEARRFVARIREATARIERLLSELLSLARIEARGVETFTPVDLGELTRRTIESLGDSEKRITLHASGDTRVRGDELWIARALINLIENGLSHGERGSPLSVEVSRSEEWVNVRVVSQGSISRHVRERLFRRFVTTRADKGGTGLGLAIVRAVTEAHGGQVELLNAGPPEVVFLVSLPPARRRAALQILNAVQEARALRGPGTAKIDQ